jgi:hypothetical protein
VEAFRMWPKFFHLSILIPFLSFFFLKFMLHPTVKNVENVDQIKAEFSYHLPSPHKSKLTAFCHAAIFGFVYLFYFLYQSCFIQHCVTILPILLKLSWNLIFIRCKISPI